MSTLTETAPRVSIEQVAALNAAHEQLERIRAGREARAQRLGITANDTNMLDVLITTNDLATLPAYQYANDSGADLSAAIDAPVTIYPGERKLIPTGIRAAIPDGFEMQIRSRSGLALKHGLVVANSPGTVDAGYRDEIKVILLNTGDQPVTLTPGMRIAQGVVAKVEHARFVPVSELPDSERGMGGFGSSGF